MGEVRSKEPRTPALRRRRQRARRDRGCICCRRRQRLVGSIRPLCDTRASYPVSRQQLTARVCCAHTTRARSAISSVDIIADVSVVGENGGFWPYGSVRERRRLPLMRLKRKRFAHVKFFAS